MDYIENRTFNEIQIGEFASLSCTLTKDDILLFAAVSGDVNPAHVDEEFARSDIFHKVIAHGMWGAALISTVLGTLLPGPGTIYLGQILRFKRPVAVGDTVTVTVTAQEKIQDKRRVVFACQCVNQAGEVVIEGTAGVMAPKEKIKRPRVVLPQVKLYDELTHYRELLRLTEGLEPIRMAVAHPVDKATLLSVREAANAGLIIPVLVGPQAKIRAAAEAGGIELGNYEQGATEHSHAAAQAVAIDPSIESTLEAAALCKMAERGQITGGIVDGPLAFDTAVAQVDKEREGVISPIAGNADILVVPDLEAGQILVKQLEQLAGARAVGLVLGARAPIVFSDPSDTPRERTAACALALLMVQAKRQGGRRLTPALPLT